MPTDVDPIVGNWYRDLERDERFEVVAVDEDEGVVEVQYFEGEVEELDVDTWYEMDLEVIEAPDDWTGPMDGIVQDDLGYAGTEDVESGGRLRPRRSARQEWGRRGAADMDEEEEFEEDEDEEQGDEWER
ncbi:MAG: DUF6763 family protein [Gammaproteobacteria bacterium]